LEVDFTGVFPWKERLRSAGSCASLSNKGEAGTSCALWGRLAMEGGRKGRRKERRYTTVRLCISLEGSLNSI